MTNAEGSGRLDRIESLLEETNRVLAQTNRGLAQTREIVESNSRGLQETRQLINETRQITESNSRAIQAMLEQRASERLEHEQRMQRLENIAERVGRVQEGLANMFVGLDEDRPTILRKLNTIDNKLDSLDTKIDRLSEEK